MLPELAEADRVFPELLRRFAPGWLTGVILADATAAAMSTLDSILHANMTVLTRDVYHRYLHPGASDAEIVWTGRAIVLGLLGIGYWLTVSTFEFLVILVTLSGAGALQLMPAIFSVCFPARRVLTRSGVVSGIVVGLLTLYYTTVVVSHPYAVHSGIWALLANTLVAIAVSLFTRPPSAATIERVHGTIEELLGGGGDDRVSATISTR